MNDDLDIAPEAPLCFDEQGRPVAITLPIYQPSEEIQDDHLDRLAAWLEWLDRGKAEAVGIRVKLIRHICGKSEAKSDSALADELNISKSRISQIRREIKGRIERFGNCNVRRR